MRSLTWRVGIVLRWGRDSKTQSGSRIIIAGRRQFPYGNGGLYGGSQDGAAGSELPRRLTASAHRRGDAQERFARHHHHGERRCHRLPVHHPLRPREDHDERLGRQGGHPQHPRPRRVRRRDGTDRRRAALGERGHPRALRAAVDRQARLQEVHGRELRDDAERDARPGQAAARGRPQDRQPGAARRLWPGGAPAARHGRERRRREDRHQAAAEAGHRQDDRVRARDGQPGDEGPADRRLHRDARLEHRPARHHHVAGVATLAAADKATAPLPAKLVGLLREAKWLVLLALAAYLLLIFVTFHRDDPSWSYSATGAAVKNAGGVVGAWVSNLLLYLFGISAYWWVALSGYVAFWGYRKIERRPLVIALTGFAVLLVASAALESLRFASIAAQLPSVHGGIIGDVVGRAAARGLGMTGGTLLLLTAAAIGFSLFSGVSWLAVSEWLGRGLEAGYELALRAWERRQDRKLGDLAREERNIVVETEKRREEDHPPLRIEPPVVEIKKSVRVQKEKQARLFEELPDTPLPPLKLLDEAKVEGEQVTAETLEFTSRLIEKKRSEERRVGRE